MTHNYIFPDFLSKFMSKVDMRVQLEASLMSMTLMMIGMIVTIVYLILYFNLAMWYKIVLVINGLAGLVFFSSYLITTFQAYNSYMDAVDFQQSLNKENVKGDESLIMKGGYLKNAKENKI